MLPLSLSPSQLLSSHFLYELVASDKLSEFILHEHTLLSAGSGLSATPCTDNAKLLMFTEGLNLQLVQAIQQQLSSDIKLSNWRPLKVEGVSGFALVASVMLNDSAALKPRLETLANQFSVELCLLEKAPLLSEPGLLVMDMDSTVIACECIDDIATLAGVGEQVAAVTAQAMQGKLDFAQSLRTRVGCLADADEAILQQVRDALPLMPGIDNLVRQMKKYRWKLAIASGGFTYFADYLLERLELDSATANTLEIIDGKLTGQVAGAIVDAEVKARTLGELAKRWNIPQSQTIAMGDGANDLLMMKAAALGVAFHAKPVVRQQADVAIRCGSLDALLWILAA